MEKLKNLCGQIPEELHNKVRTEQESLGLTLGKYLEQVLTAHFAAPAPAVRGGDRTLAFQVPEVTFPAGQAVSGGPQAPLSKGICSGPA